MSRVGLDWYKREPVAYLGDVQGLSAKQHAVYSVVLELIYVHGGEIRNDPSWIAGWISDMGAAAVRRALADLDANSAISITITDATISQKRAKSEAKTKRNRSETNSISGKKGGEKSAEKRRDRKKNNDLGEANAASEIQPEKRREEYTDTNVSDGGAVDFAKAIFENGVAFLGRHGTPEKQARSVIGLWRKDHTDEQIFCAFKAANDEGVVEPVAWITAALKPSQQNTVDLKTIMDEREADERARNVAAR